MKPNVQRGAAGLDRLPAPRWRPGQLDDTSGIGRAARAAASEPLPAPVREAVARSNFRRSSEGAPLGPNPVSIASLRFDEPPRGRRSEQRAPTGCRSRTRRGPRPLACREEGSHLAS